MDLNNALDEKICPDTFSVNMKFKDGSIASLQYYSNGNKNFPKERIEVYDAGTIYQINNFKSLKVYGPSRIKGSRFLKQNKGQANCTQAFVNAVSNNDEPPIPYNEIFEIQEWIFEVLKK